MSLKNWILSQFLPEDTDDTCGYGQFKLPEGHPFTPACRIHDDEFNNAATSGKGLHEVDWNLLAAWFHVCEQEPDYFKRCDLALQMCEYWPLARRFGNVLWNLRKEGYK